MQAIQRADSIAALRELAKRRIPRPIFDFIDGGADEEITLARNLSDFRRVELAPRVLRDVAARDSSVPILGRNAGLPLIIAPTGLAALGWPRADVLLARAAGRRGLPFVISTSSSVRLEEIAMGAKDTRLWFQVYVYKDRDLVRSLVERAKACAVEALVVTADTPVLGWRRRDHRNGFTVPLRLTPALAAEVARCWRWTWDIVRFGSPKMQNFVEAGQANDIVSLAQLMTRNMDASVSWREVSWLRDLWNGPLIVKGVSCVEDAEEAARRGVDAVWI
ncbi:MAG TPA: alpha-hydroxy acid oxidase, partial [Phenylobacterium sp.]|uniref:alpha-hydroxy acid oxidase n=1 Tax=Phenylobacterium sp. TaxID=1871053 RepID=UPI002B47E391